MFGLIVSGRPVDATPQVISSTQYAFTVPAIPTFNHIVLFILPGAQLPPDTAAAVYVQAPPSQEFRLLGGIGAGKESAIFKVSGLTSNNDALVSSDGDVDVMTDDDGSQSIPSAGASNGAVNGANIVVGISIEPAAQVDAQLANLRSNQASTSTSQGSASSNALVKVAPTSLGGQTASTKVLAQRIIGNAFNFLASFGSDTVPLKAFQDWWAKFEKRIELDPSFLERVDQG